MKKIHIIISGKVQGVGFRYWLYQKSNERNVYGWVKNKITGEVEALLIGDYKDVDEILSVYHRIIGRLMDLQEYEEFEKENVTMDELVHNAGLSYLGETK